MLKLAIGRALARRLLGVALLVAALPLVAHAQMGALKRLKNKVSPDSATKAAAAAAHDSVARDTATTTAAKGLPTSASGLKSAALAAAGEKVAGGEKVTGGDSTSKRSRLSRVASKAVSASHKFEDVTGVSVKDVALAATGAGVGVIAAKKLGVDPTSLSKAMSRTPGGTPSPSASTAAMSRMPTMPTGVSGRASRMGMSLPTGMPSMPTGAMGDGRTMPPNAVYTDADMKMMQAFQEEMMRVSMAASRGDADAEARLQRLQEISAKHEPEMERLALRGTVADTAAVRRLVGIQIDIMREWMKGSPVSAKAVKVTKSVKSGTP